VDERNWKTPREVGVSLLPNPWRITSREEGPNVKLQSATSVLWWPIFFPTEKKQNNGCLLPDWARHRWWCHMNLASNGCLTRSQGSDKETLGTILNA
jgi:hypothetical protein